MGSPDSDIILNYKLPNLNTVKKRYGIKYDNYAILLWHPVTSEIKELEEDTKNIPNHLMTPTTERTIYVSKDNRDLKWLGARATQPDTNTHKWYSVMSGIGRYNRDWNIRDVDGKAYDSWGWYWNDNQLGYKWHKFRLIKRQNK